MLVKASYSAEGAKGVQSAGGTSRRDAVAKMAEGLGGSLESFYFAFGDTDAFVPDHEVAVHVQDYNGGNSCDLQLRNPADGVVSDGQQVKQCQRQRDGRDRRGGPVGPRQPGRDALHVPPEHEAVDEHDHDE